MHAVLAPSLVTLLSDTHNPGPLDQLDLQLYFHLHCARGFEFSSECSNDFKWIGSDGFIAANTSYPAITTHTATVMIVTHLEEMNLKSTLVLQI